MGFDLRPHGQTISQGVMKGATAFPQLSQGQSVCDSCLDITMKSARESVKLATVENMFGSVWKWNMWMVPSPFLVF